MQIMEGNGGKAAHTPAVQIGNVGFICKCDDKVRDGCADAADHDSLDQKTRHVSDTSGKKENKSCDQNGTEKRGSHLNIKRDA